MKKRTEKDVEGSGSDQIWVIIPKFATKNLSQDAAFRAESPTTGNPECEALILPVRKIKKLKKNFNSVTVVHKRTIPTERPPLAGKFSANLCG
jgi:hypothetical protein